MTYMQDGPRLIGTPLQGGPISGPATFAVEMAKFLENFPVNVDPMLPQPAAPYDPNTPMPAGYGYGPGWVDAK